MKAIGIDLGLLDSIVAVCDGPQPRILENRERKAQTRSVVGMKRRRGGTESSADEGEIVVGEAALDNWTLAPKDTILSVKRLMGRSISDPEVQKVRSAVMYSIVEPSDGTTDTVHVVMGGKEYSAIDISALIIRRLKQDAEFLLNDEVTHAVITVPAYFNRVQREATRKAGAQAGLRVIKIIAEPIAAAISFGMDRGDATPKLLLVYDLGGGTFDVSVLMWAGNAFAPINLQGDMWLGDDSFDQPLVNYIVRYVKQKYNIDPTSNMRLMVELRKAAQKTKESLGSNRKVDLAVAGALQDSSGYVIDIVIEITRELYERMIRGLVNHTINLTKKALAESQTTPDQIDYVLMAGNSIAIPLLRQAVEDLFGIDKVLKTVNPRHCVALGAAIVADRIGLKSVCSAPVQGNDERECGYINEDGAGLCAACGAKLDDEASASRPGVQALNLVAPFHYGITSAGGRFSALVRKGDPLPTIKRGQVDVLTTETQQRSICVPLYGRDDVFLVDGNEKQGDAWIVLPPGLPLNSPVTFKLGLDADGIFEVGAELIDGACLPTRIHSGEARDEVTSCNPAYWRTEGLVALAAFVLCDCEWTLSPDQCHYIHEIMKRRDVFLSLENAVNASKYSAKCLWVYVASRAIERLVLPHSRLAAAYLSSRVVEVECYFRADHPSAQANLKSLIDEIAESTSIFEHPHRKVPHECEPWNS